MALPNGEWGWDVVCPLLPYDILVRIDAVKGLCAAVASDELGWSSFQKRGFALSSAPLEDSGSVPERSQRLQSSMLGVIPHGRVPAAVADWVQQPLQFGFSLNQACYRISTDGSRRVEDGLTACGEMIRGPTVSSARIFYLGRV
ncbi:hypothetical protein V6N13_059562 [Hibiscus sabdariffa]